MTDCVYFIRVVDTDFFYVGSTHGIERRAMIHMTDLKNGRHPNKRLRDLFAAGCLMTFDTIPCANREEAYVLEEKIITENADNYNMLNIGLASRGGDNLTRNPDREKIIDKMTRSMVKRWETMSPEAREKHRLARTGKNNGMFGRTHTSEAKAIISAFHKGNHYARGSVRSEETKKLLSEIASKRIGEKNPFYGKTHSEETKRKLSERFKGVLPPTCNEIEVDGVVYVSQAEAARQLGVSIGTITHRLRSKNPLYSGYTVITRRAPSECPRTKCPMTHFWAGRLTSLSTRC